MRGRPDYWRRVITGKGIWGEGQVSWWAIGYQDVAPGDSAVLYSYDVPSDRALHLYSINWASEAYFVCEGWIVKNGTTIADYLFELSRDILLGSNAGYYFGPGDTLELHGGNHDKYTAKLLVNTLGFMEIH